MGSTVKQYGKLMFTVRDWRNLGYTVNHGAETKLFNNSGFPLFKRSQVVRNKK